MGGRKVMGGDRRWPEIYFQRKATLPICGPGKQLLRNDPSEQAAPSTVTIVTGLAQLKWVAAT